jgi:hypothetical protein
MMIAQMITSVRTRTSAPVQCGAAMLPEGRLVARRKMDYLRQLPRTPVPRTLGPHIFLSLPQSLEGAAIHLPLKKHPRIR